MLKKSIYLAVSIVFIITLFFGSSVTYTLAKNSDKAHQIDGLNSLLADESKCWALDVFVVTDQSYSMFEDYDYPASDPAGYRFMAAKEVLNELILNRQEKCSEAIHRFSLITFGSHAVRQLPLIQIDLGESQKSDDWASRYFEQIDNAQSDRTQNWTDFFTAFDEISASYSEVNPITEPADYGPRKKIVIVITDGNPTDVSGTFAGKEYMCKLKKFLNDTSAWNDFHIWVVALNAGYSYLNDDGCSSTMRQDWIDITRAHQGELFALSYNDQTIPAFVNDVVGKEFGSPGKRMACNEIFYIDPYTQRAEFLFFRRQDEKNFVTLSKLDNTTLEPVYQYKSGKIITSPSQTGEMGLAGYDVSTNGGKETYVIENPLPGAWRFNVDDVSTKQCQRNIEARNVSFSAEVRVPQANAVLPVVDLSPYYDVDNENNFQVLLKNSTTGKPVSNDSEYNLDVILTWNLPSHKNALPDKTPITSQKLSPGVGGVWVSNEPVLTPELGEYNYTVVGTAPSGDKSSTITVFSVSGKYLAKNILPVNFVITSPEKDQEVACNEFQNSTSVNTPLDISIQLVDKKKLPMTADGILTSDADKSFIAEIYDDNDNKLDGIPLKAGGNGTFSGKLLTDQSASVVCGEASIKVSFVGSVDVDKYSMGRKDESIEVERTEVVGVLARFLTPQPSAEISRFEKLFDACSIDKITLIPVKVELINSKNGDRLNPTDVGTEATSVLYQIELEGPDGKETVQLNPAKDGSLYVTGDAGATVTATGLYKFKLISNSQAFKIGFTPVGDPVEVDISRQDGWITPLSCQVVTVSGWVVLAIFVGFLIFIFTGGPGGRIELKDNNDRQVVTIRLSTMTLLTWFKVTNPTFAGLGIKYMQYSKGKSAPKGSRSVLLKVVDVNDEVMFYSEVETGYPLPLTTDVNVEYFHPKVSTNSSIQL